MELILGGEAWSISVELESQAKKRITFDELPAVPQPKSNRRSENRSPAAPLQPKSSDLAIFRWAKAKNQISTDNNGNKGHVTDLPSSERDCTVQADSTAKGKSSHAWTDTNPRGFGVGAKHKEEQFRERTEHVEPEVGARSNQYQTRPESFIENRDPKRSKGEKLGYKDNREISERGGKSALKDLERGGKGGRMSDSIEETDEGGLQQTLESARVKGMGADRGGGGPNSVMGRPTSDGPNEKEKS